MLVILFVFESGHFFKKRVNAGNHDFQFCCNPHLLIYREIVYSAVVYQKYLTRLRELIIFEPWRENYHFSQPS